MTSFSKTVTSYRVHSHDKSGESTSPVHELCYYVYDSLVNAPAHIGENITTLLVKYFNDLLGDQSSERSWDEVTFFFYVGDVVCIHLGTTYANFQEKIFPEMPGPRPGKKFQTFHCIK